MRIRSRTAIVGRAGAAWLALATSAPAGADWPAWKERWLFNPVERTEQALDHFQEGAADAAVEPLETALRLTGEHPVAQYNAGTARLASGRDGAQPLLEAAAEGAPELTARAHYNLGNARMAHDLPGAIRAFEQALRHEPGFDDAKFNLELARRLLEEQQQEQHDQQEQDQQQDQQQQDQQQQQNQQQQGQQQEQQQDQQQQQQQQEQQQQQQQQQQRQEESPLPQFQDLPDMTAEEAAAILEAIENMEREQRRRNALEAARQNARGKKDW